MDEYPEQFEEATEDSKGNLFSNKIIQYIGYILWSLFIILLVVYFVVFRESKNIFEKMASNVSISDSLAVMDSTFSDSTTVLKEIDSLNIANAGSLFSVNNQVKILALENGRRQREIDHLYEQVVKQKQQFKELLSWTKANLDDVNQITAWQDSVMKVQNLKKEKIPTVDEDEELKKREQKRLEEEKVIARNAKIYSSMKPKPAAEIISQLEKELAAKILSQIRERQAAKILEQMNPDFAAQIGKIMMRN